MIKSMSVTLKDEFSSNAKVLTDEQMDKLVKQLLELMKLEYGKREFNNNEFNIVELEKEDMQIFKTAIDNGADAIMVGHLILKDVDRRYPASLSKKIIQTYLIEKYHYKGLIITDDLKMMAIRIHFNMNRAVLKAIDAGNDIVMVGLSYNKIKKLFKILLY